MKIIHIIKYKNKIIKRKYITNSKVFKLNKIIIE